MLKILSIFFLILGVILFLRANKGCWKFKKFSINKDDGLDDIRTAIKRKLDDSDTKE